MWTDMKCCGKQNGEESRRRLADEKEEKDMDFFEQRLWVNIKMSILSHVYMTYIYGIDIAKCQIY